jgi:hypothetical protein
VSETVENGLNDSAAGTENLGSKTGDDWQKNSSELDGRIPVKRTSYKKEGFTKQGSVRRSTNNKAKSLSSHVRKDANSATRRHSSSKTSTSKAASTKNLKHNLKHKSDGDTDSHHNIADNMRFFNVVRSASDDALHHVGMRNYLSFLRHLYELFKTMSLIAVLVLIPVEFWGDASRVDLAVRSSRWCLL